MTAYASGKDMLLLPDGATYHLGVKAGDLYPRILTVGSADRAKRVSTLFDAQTPVKEIHSSREFHIFSGKYKGTGISIIAIGMGAPMMDFMVREASFVYSGPMAIIRLGTCGIFNINLKPGIVLTGGKGAMYVYTNYAQFWGCANDSRIDSSTPPFLICKPTPCDTNLNNVLIKKMKEVGVPTYDGLNACGETFYSCQGRKDDRFKDKNENIVQTLLDNGVDFVDMETHQLFHLGQLRPCHTAAAAIGIVQRINDKVTANITAEQLHNLEKEAGRACLEALIDFDLK